MKTDKYILIIILFLIQTTNVNSQTDRRIKSLFLELPLDASRKSICATLLSDKRFIETVEVADTNSFFSKYTFLGLSKDKGIIKAKPDSIKVELTFGTSLYHPKFRLGARVKSQTILRTYYYYNSLDFVQKEYSNCLNIIRQTAKDSCYSRFGSNYELTGEGMTFKIKGRLKSEVEILTVQLPENKFALYLIYTRNEN